MANIYASGEHMLALRKMINLYQRDRNKAHRLLRTAEDIIPDLPQPYWNMEYGEWKWIASPTLTMFVVPFKGGKQWMAYCVNTRNKSDTYCNLVNSSMRGRLELEVFYVWHSASATVAANGQT